MEAVMENLDKMLENAIAEMRKDLRHRYFIDLFESLSEQEKEEVRKVAEENIERLMRFAAFGTTEKMDDQPF